MKKNKNLDAFDIEERILYDEISQDKLTFAQANERCSKLWDLIPIDVDVNPVRLNNLMKEKYDNDPDWNKYCKTFKIKISDVDEESVERYIKAVTAKFKQNGQDV